MTSRPPFVSAWGHSELERGRGRRWEWCPYPASGMGKGSGLSQAWPSSLKDLEGPSPARCSAILGAERGRLKPTDGAGSPRPCAGSLARASRSLSRFGPRRGAGRRPAGPHPSACSSPGWRAALRAKAPARTWGRFRGRPPCPLGGFVELPQQPVP